MTTKIRLARQGRKGAPHYAIVVAQDRSPRDGKFIEKVGFYSPITPKDNPNRISIEHDRINFWLSTGAQPTETIMHMFLKDPKIEIPKKLAFKFANKPRRNTGIKVKQKEEN
jgi:small subunit ribosomal protein S16